MVGSTISRRQRSAIRRGLSYLEVLIAAGIGLAGLLGAIALFPVAILNLQRGVVSDTVAAVGPSALEQAQAAGVTAPSNWFTYNYGTSSWTSSAASALNTLPTAGSGPINAFPGGPWTSVCIDPRFAAELDPTTVPVGTAFIGQFPYVGASNANVEARMMRVTLSQFPGATLPMTVNQARLLVKSSDDLVITRPADKTQPAVSEAIVGAGPTAVRRDYTGNFEWMITLSPKITGVATYAYDANNDPLGFFKMSDGTSLTNMPFAATRQYRASVVVFNQRQPRLDTFLPGTGNESDTERVATVTFQGGGFNGGDVTIQTRGGRPIQDLALNAGDWVMLSGILQSGSVMQAPLFQWYRVVSTQGEAEVVAGVNQRFVTLEGPDWPINQVAGGTQMTIVSGVVGVYEHLITLQ